MMFLDPTDLRQLTGYVQASAQRRWLLSRGYPFEVNALGQPVVLLSALEERLSGIAKASKKKLNWEAING